MAARPHPEQGFRTCLGILALARTYGAARLDAAFGRGASIRARSVASIRSILQNGLERAFLEEDAERRFSPLHGKLRGGGPLPLPPPGGTPHLPPPPLEDPARPRTRQGTSV